nr:retrovirus-related Pol polyprotein from transposon TNT 1-94 [Tanacetum cinerariifolium]
EDDEAISKSGTKGDEINFNANKSFPDDEFIVPRNNVFQCYGNDSYFPYILAYDPLSINNITIPDPITPSEPIIISSETPEFTAVDDHLILNEHNDSELVKYLRVAKYQVSIISSFLNEKNYEEVYVQQPPGFKSSKFPNHVCKLDKALYGLKQAPEHGCGDGGDVVVALAVCRWWWKGCGGEGDGGDGLRWWSSAVVTNEWGRMGVAAEWRWCDCGGNIVAVVRMAAMVDWDEGGSGGAWWRVIYGIG